MREWGHCTLCAYNPCYTKTMSLSALFHPRSVAVVGASRDQKKVGHQILINLQKNNTLELFPINPHAKTIADLPAYPSLSAVGKTIDLVFVAVPFPMVEHIVDECIGIHTKAVVILSAGFAETGEQGKAIQDRIAQKLGNAGIVLLGPNTMGYIVPYQHLYASFGANNVSQGPVAVISQSGAMLSAVFQEYASAKTGISFAVSLGNRTGIDENMCLEHAAEDPRTRVIAVYLESFYDIPTFLSLASKIVKTKPIFLLKGGTTERGITAAVSHTAALATPQALLRDAMLQVGVVMVDTFEQLVRATIAAAKSTFLPENVMVITNAGGPSVVLVDEASQAKVSLAKLSTQCKTNLAAEFPNLHIANPLDVLGDASAEEFDRALTILSHDITINAIACIVTQQSITDMSAITRVLKKPRGKRLMMVCLVGGDQLEPYRKTLKEHGILTTRYPNEVVETLQALEQARKNMDKTVIFPAQMNVDQSEIFPDTFLDLQHLLEKHGLQFPNQVLVKSESDLATTQTLQFPLVAKTTDLTLKHKAKLGAVIRDIQNEAQVKQAFTTLQRWHFPVVFQETVIGEVQALIGLHNDVQFGWYLAVGLGGSLSDTIADRAYCFLPAQQSALEHTILRTKLNAVLSQEQRSQLVETLNNLQHCALAVQNLTELEINPLFILKEIQVIADMKRA